MTAVGNSGNVYLLSKGEMYDGFRAYQAFWNADPQLKALHKENNLEGYLHRMTELIKELEQYGTQFIES